MPSGQDERHHLPRAWSLGIDHGTAQSCWVAGSDYGSDDRCAASNLCVKAHEMGVGEGGFVAAGWNESLLADDLVVRRECLAPRS